MKNILSIIFIFFLSTIGYTQCWTSIATGGLHSFALRNDGTLWGWGSNAFKQIIPGPYGDYNTPIQVGTSSNWKVISGGTTPGHSMGIKTDGTLWGWGYNAAGQIGNGTTVNVNTPTQIGTATDWEDVSCGGAQTIAKKTNGTIWAWGQNINGELGDGTFINKNSPVQIGTATNWSKISAGERHSVALKMDGTIWAWGFNQNGQVGDGTNTNKNTPTQVGTANNWLSIHSGAYITFAFKTDGSLWAWGNNGVGSYGNGNNTGDSNIPLQVANPGIWKSISPTEHHTLGIKMDGTLWAWGQNIYSQLGDGTTTWTYSPKQIGTDNNWKSIEAGGYYYSVALKTDNTIWTWGYNLYGYLGDGSYIDKSTPVTVAFAACSPSSLDNHFIADSKIDLYPNPTSDVLNLSNNVFDKIDQLLIVDFQGKTVLEKSNSSKCIEVQNLPTGIYLLKCLSNGITYSTKFIKE